MDDRTSEASPNDLLEVDPGPVPPAFTSTSWSQLTLLGNVHVVLQSQFVIDGAAGQMSVSVTVKEFWTGDVLATEVRPSMHFPTDMHVALLWIEERMLFYGQSVSPF